MPVPSDAQQEAAIKLARDLYKNDYANAKTVELRQALANKLLDQARQQTSGDPIVAFALCRLARTLAVQAADGVTAFRAIDTVAEKFEIEAAVMKTDVLVELAGKARTSIQHKSIAEQAVMLMDEAAVAGNFSLAAQLGKLAIAEGIKGNGKDIVLLARNRLKEIQGDLKLTAEFNAANAALANEPDDPDAHSTVASYYCFLLGNWEKGLPHMAKGSNAVLKKLAQRELDQSPRDTASRVDLADAWWDVAQKTTGKKKEKILLHAGTWYAKVQQAIIDGMVKLKVDKRLEEVEKLERDSNMQASPPM